VAVGVRDFGHQRWGQAERGRGDHVDGVETRRRATRQCAKLRNAGQIISRTQSLGVAHRRRNDRIELRQPVRQFLVEETAQLHSGEAAFEKDGVNGFHLGQGEFACDSACAHECVHGLLGGFSDSRIAVAPQKRVADADANPGNVVSARSLDEPERIRPGGIERHEAVGHVRNVARQQPRRVEGCR
jgi:hypothetical protein